MPSTEAISSLKIRLWSCVAILTTTALLAGCAGTPPPTPEIQKSQVTVRKPAATLPGTRYAWVEMPASLEAEQDARATDPAFRARLRAALERGSNQKTMCRHRMSWLRI